MGILVTGGAGFIGSHLIEILLKKGHKVVCVDDLSLGRMENINSFFNDGNFTFTKIDILENDKLNDVFKKNSFDTVFHL